MSDRLKIGVMPGEPGPGKTHARARTPAEKVETARACLRRSEERLVCAQAGKPFDFSSEDELEAAIEDDVNDLIAELETLRATLLPMDHNRDVSARVTGITTEIKALESEYGIERPEQLPR